MIIIYLSNRYIRVLSGDAAGERISVHKVYHAVDTAGCILNGTVTDEEGFLEIIKGIWESNNLPRTGIGLVIDSSQFISRVVDVPLQKPAQTLEYLSREFADADRISDPLYGYFPMPGSAGHKAKMQTVYAAVVQREFIQAYLNLFGKLGITVSSVENGVGTMIRLLASLPQMKEATGIVQFVDDMILVNILLVNGKYEYSNRTRLFSDPGTPGFTEEAARAVGSIRQFASAQHITEGLESVYIAGFSREDAERYKTGSGQGGNLRIVELDGGTVMKETAAGGRFSDYALAAGGLVKTDARTNLMSQMSKGRGKQNSLSKSAKKWLLPVILGGVLAAAAAAAGIHTFFLSLKLAEVQEYNESAEVLEACERYDRLTHAIQSAGGLKQNLQELRAGILEYPLVDSTVNNVLSSCAAGLVTAEVSSYDASTGVITFNTSAANVDQIHQFATLLSQQQIFAAVDYSGYSQDSEGTWRVKVNAYWRRDRGNDSYDI